MKSNLKIFTSNVTKENLRKVVEANYLPVFIIRKIYNSELIGIYSNTIIHIPEITPSNLLFRNKRDGIITQEEFAKEYIVEMVENGINFHDLVGRLEALAKLSHATGIVLMGYGPEELCHRSILADLLNEMHILNYRIVEYSYE